MPATTRRTHTYTRRPEPAHEPHPVEPIASTVIHAQGPVHTVALLMALDQAITLATNEHLHTLTVGARVSPPLTLAGAARLLATLR